MTERVIEVAGVEKAYRFFRLGSVSLELEAGQIMGFVGPKGAGKSTLMRIRGCSIVLTTQASQLLVMTVVMTAGALPFAAIGLFIAAYVPANVAPAIANLVFLPMLWLSGLFIPLPKFLERWAVIWPAFHLNQAALGWAGVSESAFLRPASRRPCSPASP